MTRTGDEIREADRKALEKFLGQQWRVLLEDDASGKVWLIRNWRGKFRIGCVWGRSILMRQGVPVVATLRFQDDWPLWWFESNRVQSEMVELGLMGRALWFAEGVTDPPVASSSLFTILD